MTISGSYRLLSVDNPAADLKAIFNNNISQADIDLLTAPDSKVDNVMCMNGNALSIDLKYSAKPDWNTSLNYVIGVKKDLPAPFPGNSVVVMCGENAMCETVTFPDAVYTYNFSFSSFGVTVKTASAKAGYISTQIWERIDVPLTGFYIMESNENMVKMVMADVPNMTEAAAKEMASYHALRVTEKNGVYTMVDYFGDGSEKTLHFKLGEECEDLSWHLGGGGSNLVSQTAPGIYSYVNKATDGKIAVWKGVVSDAGLTWSVEKPMNGVGCTVNYRRYADVMGTWRVVNSNNMEPMLKAVGMPADKIKEAAGEKYDAMTAHKGKGVWETSNTSKVWAFPPQLFRFGEEFTINMEGMTITEINVLTKTGVQTASQVNGLTIDSSSVVGNNFTTLTMCIAGQPATKCSTIFVRV